MCSFSNYLSPAKKTKVFASSEKVHTSDALNLSVNHTDNWKEREATGMPLRPDLPNGLNLSRRATTPVKLPKMNFPMIGGVAEAQPVHMGPMHEAPPGSVEGTVPLPEEEPVAMPHPIHQAPAMPHPQVPAMPQVPAAKEAARVIVYGKSGCMACMEAIQDLIDRQVSFTYYDVSRDLKAMQHLQAICGAGEAVVPVIISIGFGGH
jgi:hypothetical protein